jgi:hypothetical protein
VTAAATVTLNAFVAVCAVGTVESVTLAVKLNVPAAVGVPEIVPLAAASVRPAGNAPELMLQLYGVVPPLAANVVVYAVPTCAEGTELVVICTGVTAAATVTLNAFVAVCAVGTVESVTLAVKLNDPAVVGVPEIVPLAAASVRPGGNAPELMLQLYGVVPPLACNVVVYAVPTVPPGSDGAVVSVNEFVGDGARPVPDREIVLTLRVDWMLMAPEKVPLEVGPNTTWNEAPSPACKISGKAGPETANCEELLTTLAIVSP